MPARNYTRLKLNSQTSDLDNKSISNKNVTNDAARKINSPMQNESFNNYVSGDTKRSSSSHQFHKS